MSLPIQSEPRSLLRNRNFILLWCAYGVSALGDHLSEMAILKTQDALEAGGQATATQARMTFLFFVPFFLFGPIAGWLADLLPRRRVMITADLMRCAVLFGFMALMRMTDGWGTWGPLFPLLLVGLFAALFSPARAALLPTLIDRRQLIRANGMIGGLGIIATMVAFKIGGHIAHAYEDMTVAFRIDGLTFLLSALLLWFIVKPRRHQQADRAVTPSAMMTDLAAGFRYARCHRRVLELIAVTALVWFCGSLVKCVIPAIVRDAYAGSYDTVGTYMAFLGVGFIIGAVIISVLGDALRSEIAMTWGLFGISISIAMLAASVFLPLATSTVRVFGAIGIIGAGTFGVTVMISMDSLLQRIVSDRYRGRIFGVRDLFTMAALLTATGALGVPSWTNLDRWVGYILIGVAVMTFLAGVITLIVRLRRGLHGRAVTFAENLNEFVAKFWWRLKCDTRTTIPREGPAIITANHTCSADPLFLSAAARFRPISFMVAAEYTDLPFVRFFLRMVECIPVKRDGQDMAATKQGLRHLKAGKALGIFIEGRIISPGETGEPKDGVALLALKTGAPVIPAHISGVNHTDNVFFGLIRRHHARVRFGPPVDLSEFEGGGKEATRAATKKIYAAIKATGTESSDPAGARE